MIRPACASVFIIFALSTLGKAANDNEAWQNLWHQLVSTACRCIFQGYWYNGQCLEQMRTLIEGCKDANGLVDDTSCPEEVGKIVAECKGAEDGGTCNVEKCGESLERMSKKMRPNPEANKEIDKEIHEAQQMQKEQQQQAVVQQEQAAEVLAEPLEELL